MTRAGGEAPPAPAAVIPGREEGGDPDARPAPGSRGTVLMLGGFLPPPYGGIAKYMQAALPRLLERGYAVWNLQPPAERPSALYADRPGYRTDAVTPRPGRALARLLSADPGVAMRVALASRGVLRLGPREYAGHVAAVLAWYHGALRLLDGARPDLVHVYDAPWLQGLAGLLLARRLGARLVVTTFGELLPHRDELVQVDAASAAYRAVSRRVLEAADVVASMTRHCARQAERVGFPAGRVRLVRFVLGMDAFTPDADGSAVRARWAPDGERLLLYVGQVRPRKGVLTLVEALAALGGGAGDVRLLVVGPDHGHVDEVRGRARALGVEERVSFAGAVPDAELPRYYAACDVCLFPTRTEIECLGLTFVQAMFAARPVIATRIAGAPEVIRDGVDGFLVEPGDAAGFARAIERVLALSPAGRGRLCAAARERVRGLFSEEAVLGDLTAVYEQLAGR